MIDEPILPCPFCGSADLALQQYPKHYYRIRCNDCAAMTEARHTAQNANESWNRRAAPTPEQSEVEMLDSCDSLEAKVEVVRGSVDRIMNRIDNLRLSRISDGSTIAMMCHGLIQQPLPRSKTMPINYDWANDRIRELEAEVLGYKKTHRWNIDADGERLTVCRGNHFGDNCREHEEVWVPLPLLEAAEAKVAEYEEWFNQNASVLAVHGIGGFKFEQELDDAN